MRSSLFLSVVLSFITAAFSVCSAATANWSSYLGDNDRSHYSPLKQINTRNVKKLEVAWTYQSGGARPDGRSQIQCNPLIVDGLLYGTSPELVLFALDAATGKELWRFNPLGKGGDHQALGVNRGVVYWADGDDRRILYSAGSALFAVNAKDGKLIPSFGRNGGVDIRQGLGRDASQLYAIATTPGTVYRDLLILGTRVSEGPGPSAPGHVRAYNIRTGKQEWIFRTIPHPGEFGYETWPADAWKLSGGANCWAGMAVDEKRGIVFVPTGSAAFDFWGGNRLGENLFANCLIALDAATGKRLWHYQFVHHDLWDRDLPAPPTLLRVKRNGKSVDAVAQVTKSGHVFVFNRETGEPLFPIEERIVPPSNLQGESAWPTQPFPTKPAPFARQIFSADQITDISPESHKAVLERWIKVRPHTPFLPPSREGTIIFPGFDGGAEWGGAAVDPKGILYVNANEMPWILTMVEAKPKDGPKLSSGEQIYSQICAACHGANRSGDSARAFPSLENIGQKLKKPDIIQLLNTGKGMMPSVAFLSEEQKNAVAGFLLGETPATREGAAPVTTADVLINEPYSHTGYNRWLDTNGYPAVKPPWGTLNAIDLNTGEFVWRMPLGELPELTARGVPPTGAENYGGPVVTAGGLVFIGASKDEMFRAFDQKTGRILWETKLPAAGYATPATYMVNGQQFVVIACGGGKCGTKSGDAYVAFALPK
ncbi:MAG TPA: PQQ-binding-like beta-propeller repeat protein [Verrucomicrobiae bacterium]|nr:PQQ-binding-like beta-propeller repeat protein [Verrucomicrobiae bacterium]